MSPVVVGLDLAFPIGTPTCSRVRGRPSGRRPGTRWRPRWCPRSPERPVRVVGDDAGRAGVLSMGGGAGGNTGHGGVRRRGRERRPPDRGLHRDRRQAGIHRDDLPRPRWGGPSPVHGRPRGVARAFPVGRRRRSVGTRWPASSASLRARPRLRERRCATVRTVEPRATFIRTSTRQARLSAYDGERLRSLGGRGVAVQWGVTRWRCPDCGFVWVTPPIQPARRPAA